MQTTPEQSMEAHKIQTCFEAAWQESSYGSSPSRRQFMLWRLRFHWLYGSAATIFISPIIKDTRDTVDKYIVCEDGVTDD